MTTSFSELDPALMRGVWRIDPVHSTLAFSVKHAMVVTVHGRFGEFSGSLTIDPEDPSKTIAEVDIVAASIDTRSPERDSHLRSPDFLSASEFPTLTFRSKRAEGGNVPGHYRLWGDLTIRGVPREVKLEIEFQGVAIDPYGNLRTGFEGEAIINRKEWGLVWNVVLERGGILVGDMIKLSLDVSAVKQTS